MFVDRLRFWYRYLTTKACTDQLWALRLSANFWVKSVSKKLLQYFFTRWSFQDNHVDGSWQSGSSNIGSEIPVFASRVWRKRGQLFLKKAFGYRWRYFFTMCQQIVCSFDKTAGTLMVWFGLLVGMVGCELGISLLLLQVLLLQTFPLPLSYIEYNHFDHRLLSRFTHLSVGIQLSFHHFTKGLPLAWTNVGGIEVTDDLAFVHLFPFNWAAYATAEGKLIAWRKSRSLYFLALFHRSLAACLYDWRPDVGTIT